MSSNTASIKIHLEQYREHLEHDLEFIQKEIETLEDTQDKAFQDLQRKLKTRFLSLQTRLDKTNALLSSM